MNSICMVTFHPSPLTPWTGCCCDGKSLTLVRRLATSLHGKDGTLYISLSLFSSLRYTMILQLIFSLWYLWWTFLNGKGWSQHFFFFLTLRGGHFWTARAGQHIFFFVLTLRLFRFINVLDNDPSCAGFFVSMGRAVRRTGWGVKVRHFADLLWAQEGPGSCVTFYHTRQP